MNFIKKIRVKCGWTHYQMGKYLKLKSPTTNAKRMEEDRKFLSIEQIYLLFDISGLSEKDFLSLLFEDLENK